MSAFTRGRRRGGRAALQPASSCSARRGRRSGIELTPYLGDDGGRVHMPLLMAGAFEISSSEARRLIRQGGVKLDGEPIPADSLDIEPDRLDGRVLQVGKRRFRRLRSAA